MQKMKKKHKKVQKDLKSEKKVQKMQKSAKKEINQAQGLGIVRQY